EVDDFLDAIAIELDRLNTQIEELSSHARQSESQAVNFEAERNTINNALLTAQRASDDLLEQAKEKSQKLLEEADARAEKVLLSARQEKETLIEELAHLKAAEEKFRAAIRENAQETINQLKAVPAPRIPKIAAAPAAVAAVEDDDSGTFAAVEPTPAQETVSAIPVVAPIASAPPLKREEGIGQYGEMELDEDLDTID
ncbi:MAG: DivIVA domain-containing protein, partial [Coriobacteriia bacterium]|nr:DivIVA domain-containing protein [Coriobacteriia bacterium]